MKIKLIRVPNFGKVVAERPEESYLLIPPIGISIITSFLRENGFEVGQDDLRVKVLRKMIYDDKSQINLGIFCNKERLENFLEDFSDEEIEAEAEKILRLTKIDNFNIVGLSAYNGSNVSGLFITSVLSKILKEKYGKIVVVGGKLDAENLKPLLKKGYIDYIFNHHNINLPAEFNFLDFCKLVEKYEKSEIENLKDHLDFPGIIYEKEGRIKENKGSRPLTNEKPIVRPDFEGLPLDLYAWKLNCGLQKEEYLSRVLVLPYRFVIGCPFQCAFCKESKWKKWFAKDVDNVIEDLKHLSQKFDTDFFLFLNPEVNPTYEYAEEFADKLIESDLDIKWIDSVSLANVDEKLIKKLRKAGLVAANIGVESASDKILEYIEKPVCRDDVKSKLKMVKNQDVFTIVNLISGIPWERKEDIEETVDFINENNKWIDYTVLNRFFLEGKIYQEPGKYKIERLDDSIDKETVNTCRGAGYNFEEKGPLALPHEEKKKQAENSTRRIIESIDKKDIKRDICLHTIFLFSSSESKINHKDISYWNKVFDRIHIKNTDKIKFLKNDKERYFFNEKDSFRVILEEPQKDNYILKFKERISTEQGIKYRPTVYLYPSRKDEKKIIFDADNLFLGVHPCCIDVIDLNGSRILSNIPIDVLGDGSMEIPRKSIFVEKENEKSSFPDGDFLLLNSEKPILKNHGNCVIVNRVALKMVEEAYLFQEGEFVRKVEGADLWCLTEEVE